VSKNLNASCKKFPVSEGDASSDLVSDTIRQHAGVVWDGRFPQGSPGDQEMAGVGVRFESTRWVMGSDDGSSRRSGDAF